jgi:LAS superfamily LD-carboxypeptidase LdcB
MLNELELTGRARTHVVQRDDLGAAVHPEALEAFLALKAAAALDGIDLAIVSAFRDFEAQQRIWNLKFRGERPLFDADGRAREHAALAPDEIVEAILCWSALPGASRHHWGTEIDLVDRAAMPDGYRVQLLPVETAEGGIFHALHCWLDANMERFGFFRPYSTFHGGVLPEPWHLSYAPASHAALRALTPQVVAKAVHASDMFGKELVVARIQELHTRYVANIDPPCPQALGARHGSRLA